MTLNSGKYYDSIIESLTILREEVKAKSKLGLLDINKHCEDFIKELLNKIYSYELINLNSEKNNYSGLDLGDEKNGIAFQITSTKTSDKIDHTLEMCLKEKHYEKFPIIKTFVLTSKQSTYALKTNTEPHFNFNYQDNIIDFDNIYYDIAKLDVDKRKSIFEYIERELPYRNKSGKDETHILSNYLKRLEGFQTGGDSFCYWMLYYFDLTNNIAQNFVIIKSGEFPLYDLRYSIYDVYAKKDIFHKEHGELNSPADYFLLKWKLPNKIYYRVFFSARNGQWHQDLILNKSEKSKCWLAATIVKDKFGKEIVHKHIDNQFLEEFGEPNWKN